MTDARISLARRARRVVRSQSGVTSTEYTVIAGVMVITIIAILIIFRGRLTDAATTITRCIQSAVSGNFSACGGGGGSQGAGARAAAPGTVPGLRNQGVASGLVMGGGAAGRGSVPGAGGAPGRGGVPGAGGAVGPGGVPGSAGAAGGGSALGGAGGSPLTNMIGGARGTGPGAAAMGALGTGRGAAGSPGAAAAAGAFGAAGSAAGVLGGMGGSPVANMIGGGRPIDPKQLAAAQAQLNGYKDRLNSNGQQLPESWQEQGTRLWNATSLFQSNRDLNARQSELQGMAGTAHNKAEQWAQQAEQRLNAGDLQGFQQALNNSRRYNQLSNTLQGNAAGVMADAADQAMGEAANIRQISFETASAIGNPAGYLGGKASGFVVSTVADATLPDGRIKQVVVAIGTAAGAAYAGGAMPTSWQSLGAAGQTTTIVGQTVGGQAAGMAVGVADTLSSAYVTNATHGGSEAAWELGTALITHGVMNTKVFGPGENGGPPRSLNDVISQAPSAAAVKTTLENNVVPLGQLELTTKNAWNAAQNAYNSANGITERGPLSYKPLDADPAYVKTVNGMQDPTVTPQMIKDGASMGHTPDLIVSKIKHAETTGGTFFDRYTLLEGVELIGQGKGVGKGTEQHQKSAGDLAPWLPMDTNESKLGPQGPSSKAYQDNVDNIAHSLAANTIKAGPSPDPTRIKGNVAYDPQTNKPFVGDVDGVTSNVSRPGDPVRNGGVRGLGTYNELQDVSNIKSTLGQKNLESAVQHGQGARNPGVEDLPPKVIRYTPDGKVTVIEGQVNVLNAIRQAGGAEHPGWQQQAQQAQANNPNGPKLIDQRAGPSWVDQAPTQGQITLANNRNQIRTGYVQYTQTLTMNTRDTGERDRRPDPEPDFEQSNLLLDRMGSVTLAHVADRGDRVVRLTNTAAPAAGAPLSLEADFTANTERSLRIGRVIEQYGRTWGDKQVQQHMRLFAEMRALAELEATERATIDRYVQAWLNLAATSAKPGALPTTNQSAIYERLDAQASPSWRADLDAQVGYGLHAGLVQHYSQWLIAQGGRKAYGSLPAQTAVAQLFLQSVGEADVYKALFHGATDALYTKIGTRLGASPEDPEERWRRGFGFVQSIDQAARLNDTAGAKKQLEALTQTGAATGAAVGAALLLFVGPWWVFTKRRGKRGVRVLGVVLLGSVALVAGCRAQAPGKRAATVPNDFPLGRCDVKVTGAIQRSFTTPGGPAAVATVYWMTDQRLRGYFESDARDSGQVAEQDIPFVVDQAMARNPRFTPLLVMCWDADAAVSLVPGLGSRYEAVPFRPASYQIAPASRVDEAIPGHFAAQTMLRAGKQVLDFTPVGTGKLDVTAFDAAHVAGTFSYKAIGGDKTTIDVTGRFEFRRPAVPVATTARR